MQYSALHHRTWVTPTVPKPCSLRTKRKSNEESYDSSLDFGVLEGTRIPGPLIKRAPQSGYSDFGTFEFTSFFRKASWFFTLQFLRPLSYFASQSTHCIPWNRAKTVQKPCTYSGTNEKRWFLIHDLVAIWVTTKVNLIHGKKNAHSSEEFSGEWAVLYNGILYRSLATFSMEVAIWERSFHFFIWQVSALSVPHEIWTPAKLFQRLLLFKM